MALIKCLEPECTKIVSDKAEHCPECGHPIASELKKIWEATPEGKAELAARQKREKWEREDKEKREKAERDAKEESEKAKKLEIFKEIREKLNND